MRSIVGPGVESLTRCSACDAQYVERRKGQRTCGAEECRRVYSRMHNREYSATHRDQERARFARWYAEARERKYWRRAC